MVWEAVGYGKKKTKFECNAYKRNDYLDTVKDGETVVSAEGVYLAVQLDHTRRRAVLRNDQNMIWGVELKGKEGGRLGISCGLILRVCDSPL